MKRFRFVHSSLSFITICFFLNVGTLAQNAATSNSIERSHNLANQALSEIIVGNVNSANSLAASALRLNKDLPLALAVRGWAKYEKHNLSDYETARKDLEKAVRFKPRNPLFLAWLTTVYSTMSEKKLAKETAKKIIRVIDSPKTSIDYYSQAISNRFFGNRDDEIIDYTRAIQLNPKFLLAYFNRALTYYHSKQYHKAIKNLNRVIQMNPRYAPAYNNRGVLYKINQQYDLAMQDFTKAIKLNPKQADAYSNRGDSYTRKKQNGLAIQDLNNAIKLNPKFTAAYYNLGNAYFHSGDYNMAIRNYTKAIKLNPNYSPAYHNRAIAYGKIKNYDLARADINKYRKLSGN